MLLCLLRFKASLLYGGECLRPLGCGFNSAARPDRGFKIMILIRVIFSFFFNINKRKQTHIDSVNLEGSSASM